MKNESYYSATPIGGGEPSILDEAAFNKAFIITSMALGGGHFRHMATVEKRIVKILQAPRSEFNDLHAEPAIAAVELDQ
jgi:hypothetical protein